MNRLSKLGLALAAAAAVFGAYATACSDAKALNRELASQLIQTHEGFSAPTIMPLATGEFCMYSYTSEDEIRRRYAINPMRHRFDGYLPFYLSMSLEPEGLTILTLAEELGCPNEDDWRMQRRGRRCFLNLTEEGERTFGEWPNEQFGTRTLYKVPVASRELIEVTGLAVDPSAGRATTEFTWRVKREPAGALLKLMGFELGEVKPGEALLTLYDDGWRVTELKGTEVSIDDWL